jgi:hypothetical protein
MADIAPKSKRTAEAPLAAQSRWVLFAAMLCAAVAVFTGYTGRDQRDTVALASFAIIAVATVCSLAWLLGRIIARMAHRRQEHG